MSNNKLRLYARRVALALGLTALSIPAFAAEERAIEVYVVDMSFNQILDVVSEDLGVQFTGDRSNRRRLTDLRLSGTPDEIVENIMRSARMDSFTFNGQIYYAPIEGRAVRLIPLAEGIDATQARAALESAGLIIPGFDVKEVSNGGALVMSGPVRYLALTEGVLDALTVTPDVAEIPVRVRRAGSLVTENQVVVPVQPVIN